MKPLSDSVSRYTILETCLTVAAYPCLSSRAILSLERTFNDLMSEVPKTFMAICAATGLSSLSGRNVLKPCAISMLPSSFLARNALYLKGVLKIFSSLAVLRNDLHGISIP